MKAGAENRRKTIMAGVLGSVALCCILYAYNTFFGGTSAPMAAPSISATKPAPPSPAVNRASSSSTLPASRGSIAGVPAAKLATTAAALDPTLDQTAMLRTESLLYSGSGRNIFSATYTPPLPAIKLPTNVPSARPIKAVVLSPAPSGPPPPAPFNLKFFGTATREGGPRQAFLLSGEDVYLASTGEIVARKYKIVQIAANSLIVQDLQSGNTQTLPLQVR